MTVINSNARRESINSNARASARHPAVTTLLFGTFGFLCGLLLSLLLSAYSLYSCMLVI